MICNHAGECAQKCYHKKRHAEMNSCISRFPKETCPFPLAVCVPWVEPVKVRHCGCAGCAHFIGAFDCGHQDVVKDMAGDYCGNWTPKQPEPVVKINFTAVEPKAEPGLVSYSIIGGKGNELWLVQRPAGAIALYKAVGRKDFAYIETEIGDKFISLQAFDDPPKKCWFRETK